MVDSDGMLIETLTERELEFLAALADGLTNQEIANRLHVALTTVKWYNTQIFNKLNVSSRQEAVARAYALSLIHVPMTTTDTGGAVPEGAPSYSNLPVPSTPFLGRREEIREISQLLKDPAVSLVTILGVGGMGKTRLAIQLGREHLTQYANGVVFIGLAPLTSPDGILPLIAEQIHYNIQQDERDPKQQVLDFLAPREMLLIIDNFEHVISGAALVADMLAAAPKVKIIVTSRERLNLSGEIVYALDGLAVPPRSDLPPAVPNPMDYDSIVLFVQSARRARPDLSFTDEDMRGIVQICQLVDGLPLAIQLAAGWLEALTVEQILDELRRSIDILETEMRDVPERHRSIRATFNYTWERLTPEEQQAFMKLSVFRGGFTAEAAQHVTGGANVRLLRRMVGKSLLVMQPLSTGRYDIHELLRQFAEEKLVASGLQNEVQKAHTSYFIGFLRAQHEPIYHYETEALRRIDSDFDNIAAAWPHLLLHDNVVEIKDAVVVMATYAEIRGRNFEGIDLMQRLLDVFEQDAAKVKPQWLYGLVLAQYARLFTGIDPLRSRKIGTRAIEILSQDGAEYGESIELGTAYEVIATWYSPRNRDLTENRNLLHRSRDIFKRKGADRALCNVLHEISLMEAGTGDFELAKSVAEEALQLAEAIGDKGMSIVVAKFALANALSGLKQYDAAIAYYNEILPVLENFGNLYQASRIRGDLAEMHLECGDVYKARLESAETLRTHRRLGRDWQLVGSLNGIARASIGTAIEVRRAVEVQSFVAHYPFSTSMHRNNAIWQLGRLKPLLPEDEYDQALEKGKSYALYELADELEAEFRNPDHPMVTG